MFVFFFFGLIFNYCFKYFYFVVFIYLFFCNFSFLAGVIPRDKVPGFELMLWRICRGNVFLRTAEIDEATEDPTTV